MRQKTATKKESHHDLSEMLTCLLMIMLANINAIHQENLYHSDLYLQMIISHEPISYCILTVYSNSVQFYL